MESYRGKRIFDLLLVTLSAPLWVPVSVVVAVFVWAKLGRPVLFSQDRIGYAGKPFRMLKFRTMLQVNGANWEPAPDSVRLTPFGNSLRGTSLDELPELVNVLAGDMSLVGPRPLLTRYLHRYSQRHQRRHLVRPGVTGLAQVKGRNILSWVNKFELDVEYVERNSLWLDLWILFLTMKAVMIRDGISAPGDATTPEFTGYEPPDDPPSTSSDLVDPC